MRTAFYAGASGLLANQKAMDNIANNVADIGIITRPSAE